jgi:glycosyltransferase involved in cell wall biosynthesis
LEEQALFTWSGLDDSARSIRPGPVASISVVIPARNEAANIGWVLRRLPACVDEVVLVDGRSTDGTVDIAREIRPDLVVVTDSGRGKGAALRLGFAAATCDWVVMIDADGSMDPEEIELLVTGLAAGNDLARGSRFAHGGGTADITWVRRMGNAALLTTANVLFGTVNTDLCYGFAAFRRQPVESLQLDADGFEIEAQFYLRATRSGLRICEVPSFEAPRRSGMSSLNAVRDGWRILGTIFRERIAAPRVVAHAVVETPTPEIVPTAAVGHGFLSGSTELAAVVIPRELEP